MARRRVSSSAETRASEAPASARRIPRSSSSARIRSAKREPATVAPARGGMAASPYARPSPRVRTASRVSASRSSPSTKRAGTGAARPQPVRGVRSLRSPGSGLARRSASADAMGTVASGGSLASRRRRRFARGRAADPVLIGVSLLSLTDIGGSALRPRDPVRRPHRGGLAFAVGRVRRPARSVNTRVHRCPCSARPDAVRGALAPSVACARR